jgi:hypothetical protein
MFIIAFDGSLENVAIETPNPLVEGKYISRFQVEGVQISTIDCGGIQCCVTLSVRRSSKSNL